jgi:putative SOS response-associated peptidase YedK
MCGRYSITIDKSTIEYHFNAKFATGQQEFTLTYNAAPSQLFPITEMPTWLSLSTIWKTADHTGCCGCAAVERGGPYAFAQQR